MLFRRAGALALFTLLLGAAPSPRPPLQEAEIVFLLRSGVPSQRVLNLVSAFGIGFQPSERSSTLLRAAGANPTLIDGLTALRSAAPTPVPAGRSSGLLEEPDLVAVAGPNGRFFIGRFEISNRAYLQFCARAARPQPTAPFWGQPSNFPVVNVSWHDAVLFTRWLSIESGKSYRLPTESEWELAASAGRSGRSYPWGEAPPKDRCCFGKGVLCPFGSFAPNEWGLHDFAGSVYEWCADVVGSRGQKRILRGGSWSVPAQRPEALRIAAREMLDADKDRNDVGFRVVRDP